MSTGESDYAKRVVELSMQLANSRADVENLRMRIKAVDKEHEQLKKDRADMVDRFAAALRRAKVEGMREARARIEHAFEHGDIVQDVLDDLDARAAQIEEGE